MSLITAFVILFVCVVVQAVLAGYETPSDRKVRRAWPPTMWLAVMS